MTEGWGWFIAKTVAKTGVKMALNACMPGLGAAAEFADAWNDYRSGDMVGCLLNTVSGIGDVVTAGMMSNIAEAMKGNSKKAVIEHATKTVKSLGKKGTKEVGDELSKQLAKGTFTSGEKEAAIKFAREKGLFLYKKVKKEVGKKVERELAKGVVPETVEEVLSGSGIPWARNICLEVASSGGKQSDKAFVGAVINEGLQGLSTNLKLKKNAIPFVLTKEAAKTGAMDAFNDYSNQILIKDCSFALAKLGINVTETRGSE